MDVPFSASLALDPILPLAQAAYDLTRLPEPWKLIAKIEPDDFGFIAAAAGMTAISFRGTQSHADWLADFDALVIDNPFGAGSVHQGFASVYCRIRASVVAALQHQAGPLIITGHSLGAALATLCAADFARAGWRAIMYTWAGPRVGLPNFADWFDAHVPEAYRIVNMWDVVPRVPSAIHGYKHVGHGVLVNGGFTTDLHHAHSLDLGYKPGLEKITRPIQIAKVA
jgi:triacylglycerol lipase